MEVNLARLPPRLVNNLHMPYNQLISIIWNMLLSAESVETRYTMCMNRNITFFLDSFSRWVALLSRIGNLEQFCGITNYQHNKHNYNELIIIYTIYDLILSLLLRNKVENSLGSIIRWQTIFTKFFFFVFTSHLS